MSTRPSTAWSSAATPGIARAEVVDLKILRHAAILAAPSIAREYRAGELAVGPGFKPLSRLFPSEPVQSCSS